MLSGLFELKDVGDGGGYGAGSPTIVATILAFVVGYWSIAFLLRFLTTHTLKSFVAYRVIVGALVLPSLRATRSTESDLSAESAPRNAPRMNGWIRQKYV